jgi:Rab9 effector protein with kelch motifs
MSWDLGQYVGSPPSARYGHTATAIGPHLLIFGGWDYSNSINEIIVLREFTGDKSMQEGETVEATQDAEGIDEEYGD